MDWIITPDSSSIGAFAYESEGQLLFIRFNSGRTYRYSGVPYSVFSALSLADSKGTYFNAYVQGRYPYAQA